jgi:hypothetical protein
MLTPQDIQKVSFDFTQMAAYEITQFTFFQQAGGMECRPVTAEITPSYLASMLSITIMLVCVPPTRKKTSACGHWQASLIFFFALSQNLSSP